MGRESVSESTEPSTNSAASATESPDASEETVPSLKYAPLVLLAGAALLEMRMPELGINVGNLVLTFSAGVACVLALLFHRRLSLPLPRLMAHDFAYLAYLGIVVASILWSRSPTDTAVQAVYLIVTWLATYLCARANRQSVVRAMYSLAVLASIASVLLLVLSPASALQPSPSTSVPELRGVFSHQLRLGLFLGTALGLIFVAVLNGESRQVFARPVLTLPSTVLVVSCFVAAFARLYSVAIVLAVLACIMLTTKTVVRVGLLAFSLLASVVLVGMWAKVPLTIGVDESTLTLTGRTIIWARTLDFVGPSLVWGLGYATYNDPSFDFLFPAYRPAHPHNSLLQAYFETGYVGLVLTLLVMATHVRTSLRFWKRTRVIPYSYFLVILTVLGSLFGSNYAGKPTFLLTATLLMISVESRARITGHGG